MDVPDFLESKRVTSFFRWMKDQMEYQNEDESEKKMHFILHHKESREASTSFVVCVATYKHLSKELS